MLCSKETLGYFCIAPDGRIDILEIERNDKEWQRLKKNESVQEFYILQVKIDIQEDWMTPKIQRKLTRSHSEHIQIHDGLNPWGEGARNIINVSKISSLERLVDFGKRKIV